MKYILFSLFGGLVYISYTMFQLNKTQQMMLINQQVLYDSQQEVMERIQKLEKRPIGPVPTVTVPVPSPVTSEAPVRNNLKLIKTNGKLNHKQLDIFCMAKNIYHEAGNQNRLGKYAVAQVTINRKLSGYYPNTVCDVVMQDFQFSWANDRKIRWTRPKGPVWNESLKIAEDVIRNGRRVDGLGSALFYHADYVSPNWKKPEAKLAKVGVHIFYADAR